MKLVIDANTLVSGSLWQGPPAQLITAALAGRADVFLSLPLLLELRETLQRPKFAARLAAAGETPDSLVERYRAASHEAPPARIMPPAGLRDVDDVHVLECAVGAGVDFIVTGDGDLLTMGFSRASQSSRRGRRCGGLGFRDIARVLSLCLATARERGEIRPLELRQRTTAMIAFARECDAAYLLCRVAAMAPTA